MGAAKGGVRTEMSVESIKLEINIKIKRINQLRTRIRELHYEIDELDNEIQVLYDNLSLIQEKEEQK